MEDNYEVRTENGVIRYYKNGLLHRDNDFPAIEWNNGNKVWWFEGKLHRINGPTVEYSNGNKEWWYEGKQIKCSSQEEFKRIINLQLFW